MSYEKVNEPIQVLCSFYGKKVMPRIFHWRNREHRVLSLNSLHTSREGTTKLFHFAISTSTSVFRLTFNSSTLEWILDEIYLE